MARRKTPQRVRRPSTNAVNSAAEEGRDLPPRSQPVTAAGGRFDRAVANQFGWPPGWVRNTISLLILLHGLALFVAVSSNLAPSYLQGLLLNRLAPYLNATHQAYNALPLELTRGELADFPLQVELRSASVSQVAEPAGQAWQPMSIEGPFNFSTAPTGQRASRWSNLARWLALTASADPEDEILADFAARCVTLAERQLGQRFAEVRLISPKVLSYDEAMALAGGTREPSDEAFQPTIVYGANIVRLPEGAGPERLSLVAQQPAVRTAKPASSSEGRP